jgi:hypothetical protein
MHAPKKTDNLIPVSPTMISLLRETMAETEIAELQSHTLDFSSFHGPISNGGDVHWRVHFGDLERSENQGGRMQTEYINRLGKMVRSIVKEIEAQIGFEITVKVDAAQEHLRPAKHRGMRCEMDEYKAEISIASTEYFPDASVFHELQHIRRFLVDGVPKLIVCEDYELWDPQLDNAIIRLDNNLEHLVIVPIELREFPERRAYWEERFEAQISLLSKGSLSETDSRWAASLVSASVQHLGLGRQVCEMADVIVRSLGAESLTRRYREVLAANISSKEQLARATFDRFELPLPAACLEYIDTSQGSSRQVALREIALGANG